MFKACQKIINFRKPTKKFWLTLVVVLVVLVVGYSLASAADVTVDNGSFNGSGVTGNVQSVLLNLLLFLVKAVTKLLLWFIGILVGLFNYNDFGTMQAVQVAWPLVRDLANIFFVVILLLIGFSTILRIGAYEYKKLLFKFVLMALLINFSKTIFLFAIDGAQVIMLTFVAAFREAMVVNLVSGFGLTQILELGNTSGAINFGEVLIGLFLALIMMVVALGTMIAYAAVLLERIITLWILLILSPLAFLLSVTPSGSKYSGEIWSKLAKALVGGIGLAFFMWLSMTILSYGVGSQISAGNPNDAIAGASSIKSGVLFTYVVCIALLWSGLAYAAKMGGMAGSVAGKVKGSLSKMGKGALVGAGLGLASIGPGKGKYSLRNLAGGIKEWRSQRNATSKEKWAGHAQELGGKLNKAQITATTYAKNNKVKAATAVGAVLLAPMLLPIAAGAAALAGVGHIAGKRFSPKYKTKADEVAKSVSGYTSRNASLADRKQLNQINETKRKKSSEETRLRGERAEEIHASIFKPEDENELKKLKKKEEEAKKNPANPTIQLTRPELDKIVVLEAKRTAANDAALGKKGEQGVYREYIESSLSGAKDDKEITEILSSMPRKLREEIANGLDMKSLQTSGGIDTSKLEAFLKATKAADRVASIDSGETLRGMLAEDPSLVKSIGSKSWSDKGVHQAVINSGIGSKYVDDLTPDQRNNFKIGSQALLTDDYSSPDHLDLNNSLGNKKSASFKARQASLSAGNIAAFADIGTPSAPQVAPQFIEALKGKVSSFKHVSVDDVSKAKLDAIIENMKAETIHKMQDVNEDLYNKIIERFQQKYSTPGNATYNKWRANNNLKQYAP